MKKKILAIVSITVILAMLCAVPSFAYLTRETGTVGGYSAVRMIWGSNSSGYYSNTYVSSAARGSIGYIYAKIWLRTTAGQPYQIATNSSSNANANDCDSLPGVMPVGTPITARSWNYVRLTTGETWGRQNTDTTLYKDYVMEYSFD